MKKELLNTFDKELLFKDLCARLPYRICVEHTSGFRGILHDITVYFTYNEDDTIKDYLCYTNFFKDKPCKIEFFKPYLFPLSSMTEEQKKELQSLMAQDSYGILYHTIKSYDYLNKHHFDYRGLIPMGLALDATGLDIY